MRSRKQRTFEMPFEVERGSSSAEYVAVYEVSPGEKPTGPTYDCSGTPGSGPEVESCDVYLERKVKKCPCEKCRTTWALGCVGVCDCHGAKRVLTTVRERRPELDDLVDSDELLEHAAETAAGWDDGPDPDDERDRRRDMALERD